AQWQEQPIRQAPADGIMKAVHSHELLSMWEKVLDVQTQLFGPKEVDVLISRCLGKNSRGILEVGSGSGHYGSFLSSRLPGLPVYGLEANPNFIEGFQRRVGSSSYANYSVDQCKVGQDRLPTRVSGRFDECILRLVLQHVSSPTVVLNAL